MTLTQIIIILAGLFIGYRLVSYMLSPGTGDDRRSRPSPPHKDAGEEQERPRDWRWHDTSVSPPAAAAPTWYQTLGVNESAGREEIDHAYRQQISQYHPDKVATMGEAIRQLAEARTKEINAAYESAMRQRR
ncbi:J domain-containing protein [Rhodanobacter ginsengiterrae]|uniref:J domain-containing protein n=1 Tax=Rhodanobacter ginsengiterrae TaxID=2008451 RepID=UPI003CFBB96C